MDIQPGVVKTASGFGQVFFADLHYQRVDLHHVDGLDFGIPDQLPHHAAVTGADDQNLFYVGMHSHGNVGNHLVVDELILFREHHIAVQREEAAEFRGLKHVNALEFTFAAIELTVYPNGELHIGGLGFREPEIHKYQSFLSLNAQGKFITPRSCRG